MRRRLGVITGAGICVGALALALGPAASAAILVVDRSDDANVSACTVAANDCTLRGAVANSNGTAGVPDEIAFAASLTNATDTLTVASELLVTDAVTVSGPGAGVLAISGNQVTRIFNLNPATTSDPVTISGLTLTLGDSTPFRGGAILNEDAVLTLADSALTGNVAEEGGAIFNLATDGAGGASNQVIRSTIANNRADSGGGIMSNGSLGTVQSSTITDNDATPPVMIGGGYTGGGIRSAIGGSILNSTIAGNYARDGAGGVFASIAGSVTISNSIIADNAVGSTPSFGPDIRGTFAGAFSLVENPTGVDASLTDSQPGSLITGVDPLLGGLASNGGPTQTLRPAAASPVVDKGGNTGGGITVDQRLLPRLNDLPGRANSAAAGANGADMGAVELTAAEAVLPPASGGTTVSTPVTQNQPLPAAKCKKPKKKKKGKGASAAAKCKKKKKKKK